MCPLFFYPGSKNRDISGPAIIFSQRGATIRIKFSDRAREPASMAFVITRRARYLLTEFSNSGSPCGRARIARNLTEPGDVRTRQ